MHRHREHHNAIHRLRSTPIEDVAEAYDNAGADYVAYADGDPALLFSFDGLHAYLRAHDTVADARASIGRYLGFYNSRRPDSSLDRKTPDHAYFTTLPHTAAA